MADGRDEKMRREKTTSRELPWIGVPRVVSIPSRERAVPAFDDMEEPTVEIAAWTTAREEALKKVSEEVMTDECEWSTQVVDANRQKYKDMLSSLALRDATEEEYRKTRGVGQPYRGMTRPPWQKWRVTRVAEEVHTVYLLDKWAKMEARNLKRFVTAVGGLSALELTRLGVKPREALPRRYDAELYAALKQGTVRRHFTGGTRWYGLRGIARWDTSTRCRMRCSS